MPVLNDVNHHVEGNAVFPYTRIAFRVSRQNSPLVDLPCIIRKALRETRVRKHLQDKSTKVNLDAIRETRYAKRDTRTRKHSIIMVYLIMTVGYSPLSKGPFAT